MIREYFKEKKRPLRKSTKNAKKPKNSKQENTQIIA